MVFNSFQLHDLLILFPSLGCLVASIVLYAYHKNEKTGPAVILLTLAALGLRVFMAHLDPYLWDWDERYHALVARNLMHHPFVPTLYDHPVLAYDFKDWTRNYIWLHKQPLALWQMALSFYLFGINQFTARFPMIVEGVLMVVLIYRIGELTINKYAAYLAALLYTVSYFSLNFMTGGEATDHVDFALIFYVSASIWAWIEYRRSSLWPWVILIGVFAGLAVLSKWVVGLVIFPAWVIFVLSDKEERRQLSSYTSIALALIISVIVFLPWQLYARFHYPTEYQYELTYNADHLFKSVEGHGETGWYYLMIMGHNYGVVVPYIILIALILLWRNIERKDYRIFLFSCILIPYFGFSILAATKMPAYCYLVCVPVYLALGSLAYYIQKYIDKKDWKYSKYLVILILLTISILSMRIDKIANTHAGYNPVNYYRINKVRFTEYFRKIGKTVPKDYVIFGFPYNSEIEMMFYTGNTCYNDYPTFSEYKILKKYDIKIAIIPADKIPTYLQNDPNVLKIKGL